MDDSQGRLLNVSLLAGSGAHRAYYDRSGSSVSELTEDELRADIRPTGFFNQKAASIRAAAREATAAFADGRLYLERFLEKTDASTKGVVVTQVEPSSPAGEAGLRRGDVILEVDGVAMDSAGDLQRLMVVEKIGVPVGLHVLRGGRELELTLVPAELDG